MKCSGVIKKLLILFVSIFLILEGIFLISPKIININSYKNKIYEYAKNEIGIDLTFNDVQFKTYPDFSVYLDVQKPKIEGFADVNHFELKFFLPKLILKKLDVRDVKIDDVKVYAVRFKDNTTNIERIINRLPFDIKLENTTSKIDKYKLFFADKTVNQNIEITGNDLFSRITKNDIEAKINAEISAQKEIAKINLDIQMPNPDKKRGFKNKNKYFMATGYIKNLRPEIFKEYIKAYISKDIVDLKGVIDAEFKPTYNNDKLSTIDVNILINDLKIISQKAENSIIFNGKNTVKSKLFLDHKDLKIENFEFSGEGYKIFTNGEILKYKAQKPKLNLSVKIENSKVEALYWMLPSNLFTKLEEIRKIKKYNAHGIANGEITIKGDIKKPETEGAIDFWNIWILDGLPSDVPKATVKTKFLKDKVSVDVKVWATPNEFVTVKGYSNFYDLSDNEYQINSSESVPLSVAQKLLTPISDVLGFIIGPVPIMKIDGYGNIDLNAGGSQTNPNLNGYFNFKNASASFNDIYGLKLENANGRIDFKKDKVYFKNETGTILNQPASISGVSDISVNIDYIAEIKNIPLNNIFQTLKTSPMLKEFSKQVSVIDTAKGTADVKMNIRGHFDDPHAINKPDVIKYMTPSGIINIRNGEISLKNPKTILENTNGTIEFDIKNFQKEKLVKLDLLGNLFNSPLYINGEIIDEKANLNIKSDKMKLIDSAKFMIGLFAPEKYKNIKTLRLKDVSPNTIFNIDMKYFGNIENIEINKVDLNAIFKTKVNNNNYPIDILSGVLNFNNGNLQLKNFNAKFYNTVAKIDGKIDKALINPNASINLSVHKLDIGILNLIKNSTIIPAKYSKILNSYKDYKGIISADLQTKNNNINGNIWLRGISFNHSVLDYPFSIDSADFKFINSNLEINRLSALFANTPIFINGKIKDIIRNPRFDIYFTSKLSKEFVDNYINTNISYPLNVKGEILLSSRILGNINSLNINPSIKLENGADISYMGANFGDENSIRELSTDIQIMKDKIILKNANYSKYIYSQNNKLYPLPLLNLKADIKLLKNNFYINYLKIKTYNPIGANLFNAILKKSLIKKGNITCDLNIKGSVQKPEIIGTLGIKNVEIPSYETSIESVSVNFTPKYIDIDAKTNYLDSDIDIIAKLKNNQFNKIYLYNLDIYSKHINLTKLFDSFNEISYSRPIQIVGQKTQPEQIPFKPEMLTIEKGSWKIDDITFNTLNATDFTSKLNFRNNTLNVSNILLKVANGKVFGDFNYNFKNAHINANLKANNVNANEIANGAFKIKNQIYGILDGEITLTSFGGNDLERLENLNGSLNFNINDGKIPKLGALEYLLRAGNLVKGGISGLTLNSLTGLFVPMHTGNFDEIKGHLQIDNGIAKNIKISSKGKNLSILITGDYNLISSEADIYVLGKLSKDIDTILGIIGNASLNSFFNLIPGINIDKEKDISLQKLIDEIPELGAKTDKVRIFRAKVDGDINSDNFVSSFEWLGK